MGSTSHQPREAAGVASGAELAYGGLEHHARRHVAVLEVCADGGGSDRGTMSVAFEFRIGSGCECGLGLRPWSQGMLVIT